MILEHWKYRDPLEGLIAQESRSCKGCKHLAELWGAQYCEAGHAKKHGSDNMRRCANYREIE